MLEFKAKQKIFNVDNIKFGGQPGELPTVLVGNLFYKGMPEVTNHESGMFDKQAVLKWIRFAEELAERTGVPHCLDVMAMYPNAMRKYVGFISEHSENPILIDGANPQTRIAGLEVARELGLQERIIHNAISSRTLENEIEAIRESGVTNAIVLAYNEMDYSPEGRISILKGSQTKAGLLKVAREAGVKNVLVDTVVFDVPSIAYAAEAVKLVKEKLGYPSGCSPANAMYDWKRVRSDLLKAGIAAANAAAHAIVQFCGADFLIYGPIKQAKNIIPACAVNDAIIAYYAIKRFGRKPRISTHPLYKIF